MTTETTKPAHKIRSGALHVTLWKRTNEKGDWYSVVPPGVSNRVKTGRSPTTSASTTCCPGQAPRSGHSWILERQQADQKARKESEPATAA